MARRRCRARRDVAELREPPAEEPGERGSIAAAAPARSSSPVAQQARPERREDAIEAHETRIEAARRAGRAAGDSRAQLSAKKNSRLPLKTTAPSRRRNAV
jgi:hypothetical protein